VKRRHIHHIGTIRYQDNVGYKIEDTRKGKNLFYAPGLGVIEDHVLDYMKNADVVLIDGTVWTDDEMSKHGINNKKAVKWVISINRVRAE